MSVRLHPEKLRANLDGAGVLIDVLMIVLVIANLALILFDWAFRIDLVQSGIHSQAPALFRFYNDSIHANFVRIDLYFVAIYLTEFVIRWGFAIGRRTYHRWFFYPFVHWYDLLGCIPVGSFRWLRILRLVSLMYRLQRLGVVDFSNTALGQTVIKYYRVLVEEISDRVVINVLDGAQREIRTGGAMMHRIEQDVLAPRRQELVNYLAGRIADATRRSHDQYRDALSDYLFHLTDEAVTRTAAGRRLAAIPVAGPRAIALLGETVRDAGTALVAQLVEDISDPAYRPRLDALIDTVLTASGGDNAEVSEMIRQTLLEVLEHVKQQVAVQHWKNDGHTTTNPS
jgi:hypothetical protein